MTSSNVRELGQLLRLTREEKGITLAEAQQATKIRQALLLALEEENYGALPPTVYIRGFLKNYSNFLGLNPVEVVQRFDEIMEAVAMGINPYASSTDSGFVDSGTASADSGRALAPLNDTYELVKPAQTNPPTRYIVPATKPDYSRALVPLSPQNRNLAALRTPDKYVLKPAVSPMKKTAFYVPNIMPVILVLIILGAAFLLVYRGFALPPEVKKENVLATPNIFSAPTVTPLSGRTDKSQVIAGITAPPYFTPDPIVVSEANTNSSDNAAQPSKAPSTAPTNLNINNSIPTVAVVPTTVISKPVKIDLTVASGNSSWVQIWVDDKEEVNRLVDGPKTFTFDGKDKVEVALGRPSAVTIKINGVEKTYADNNDGVIIHAWYSDGRDEKRKPKN